MSIQRDEGYTLVPKRSEPMQMKKGIQCGECGAKFDHDKAYGFVCINSRCPIQLKPTW